MKRKPTQASIRKKMMKRLEKECKALWHQVVCKNAKGVVEINTVKDKRPPYKFCGHHIFRDGNCAILRYDPDNGVWVDHYEHCKIHQCGEAEMLGIITRKRGQAWMDRLLQLKRDYEGYKYTVEILQDVKYKLEELLKKA